MKEISEKKKRQMNVWMTDAEHDLCVRAMQAENLRTLSPWIRKCALDRAQKVLRNAMPIVAQSEGETPCVKTDTTETTAPNAEGQSNELTK